VTFARRAIRTPRGASWAVEMFVAGALNAKAMVSHAYALADYGEAIEAFRAGTGRKIQIRPQARESMELL
jgi:threonine dehydrogenase-like Zn-dependent dehydrogenase